ncbi:MAG: DUF1292 domain-containing protein [Erysipelotrichia bacterium]|nr:DUF1292 domain-containing protein [Erysipelotrichia bacterium]
MNDSNRMTITDENGNEKVMEIILTFDSDDGSRHFVLFKDPSENKEESVYAYSFDDDGNLDQVIDEEELEMCGEVLSAFQNPDVKEEPDD